MSSQPLLNERLSIAPMMEWTDPHYRAMMRCITRKTVLYTEMVVDDTMIHSQNKDFIIGKNIEEDPSVIQLGGFKPDSLALAAELCEQYGGGYGEINLNCGCPSQRVAKRSFGAKLMLEPELVREIVQSMQRRVSIPVTIKCRIGADEKDSYQDLVKFICSARAGGARKFIIHARKCLLNGLSTKQNREIPPLRYDIVHRLVQDFPDLVFVLNGGIKDFPTAHRHMNPDGYRHIPQVPDSIPPSPPFPSYAAYGASVSAATAAAAHIAAVVKHPTAVNATGVTTERKFESSVFDRSVIGDDWECGAGCALINNNNVNNSDHRYNNSSSNGCTNSISVAAVHSSACTHMDVIEGDALNTRSINNVSISMLPAAEGEEKEQRQQQQQQLSLSEIDRGIHWKSNSGHVILGEGIVGTKRRQYPQQEQQQELQQHKVEETEGASSMQVLHSTDNYRSAGNAHGEFVRSSSVNNRCIANYGMDHRASSFESGIDDVYDNYITPSNVVVQPDVVTNTTENERKSVFGSDTTSLGAPLDNSCRLATEGALFPPVHGVMIGRAAFNNPLLFATADSEFFHSSRYTYNCIYGKEFSSIYGVKNESENRGDASDRREMGDMCRTRRQILLKYIEYCEWVQSDAGPQFSKPKTVVIKPFGVTKKSGSGGPKEYSTTVNVTSSMVLLNPMRNIIQGVANTSTYRKLLNDLYMSRLRGEHGEPNPNPSPREVIEGAMDCIRDEDLDAPFGNPAGWQGDSVD